MSEETPPQQAIVHSALPSFRRAMEFVNQVAGLVEKTDHHPDLIVIYRTVRIEMSTHDVGGLTDRDFSLIAEINEIPTDR